MVLEDPYRLFFPLGMLAGIWGVMMWPMLYGGWLKFYPGEAHTRMMIEGFMGAFVIGFSGTAFPRLTGNRSWFRGEFVALLLLWLLTVASHAAGMVAAGDAAFCGLLAVLFLGMAGRWISGNKDTPPPGFVLAFAGILGAAVSAWALSRPGLSPAQDQWARLWLFQGFNLLARTSALENVELPLLYRGYSRKQRHKLAREALASVGLLDKERNTPAELSGGQQQRVAIARAIVTNPETLFADEPTGNLDSRAGADVLGFLRNSVRDHQQTIVMVTHDPVAASYSDRVVFLSDGRIVDELQQPTAEAVLDRLKGLDVAAIEQEQV